MKYSDDNNPVAIIYASEKERQKRKKPNANENTIIDECVTEKLEKLGSRIQGICIYTRY